MNKIVYELDKKLGEGLERTIIAHHNRRLRKIGWDRAVDPTGDTVWAAGDPPPRSGNSIDVLVDGGTAFPTYLDELSHATSRVYFSGWMLSSSFKVVRGDEPIPARDFLAELAERVDLYLLLWGGAPLPPIMLPSRYQMLAKARALV